MVMKKRGIDIVEFLLMVGIVILINIIVSQYFFRIDLTEDKRYTISNTSKEILKGLDDVVYVEVYLEGQFPSGFKRLQGSIREMLDEFRIYGGTNIQYKFVDPSAEKDDERRNRIYSTLAQKGIQPTNLFAKEKDKKIEKLIFPGALVAYKEKEVPVMFLKGNKGAGPEEILNQSVEGLEFELITAIRQLTQKKRKSIAFVEGHGEFPSDRVSDISRTLAKFYDVYRLDLDQVKNLENYDALIIAHPRTEYSEKEKFMLDQFIMNGGKALFYMDPINIDMDSIGENGTLATSFNSNLDDLLFKYGVRLNANLIQDLNSGVYPMNVGNLGDKPQIQLVNWKYFPLLNTYAKHPIVKNLDAVYSRFVSSIDTVKAVGIKKTPLVLTSEYSKVLTAPFAIEFNQARMEADPKEFNKGSLPVYYLLEGSFISLYKNRPLPVSGSAFVDHGKPTKIIVCSDADIITNETGKSGRELPVGFDKFSGKLFGNKDLIVNSVDFLLEDRGIIDIRSKEITLRPLDKVKVEEERSYWQIINLVMPVMLLLLFGVSRYYLRKRKYENFKG
jgi:ABC-2 type transport system permease protein